MFLELSESANFQQEIVGSWAFVTEASLRASARKNCPPGALQAVAGNEQVFGSQQFTIEIALAFGMRLQLFQ